MTMFCKYCGKEIATDSIYCSWCGKNITKTTDSIHNIKVEDPVQVVLKEEEKQQWQSTENLYWQKPYAVRVFQIVLLLFLLSCMIYGIVWCIIGGKGIDYIPYPWYINNRYELLIHRYDPLGIIEVRFDLNEFDHGKYYDEWQEALKCMDDHKYNVYNNPCWSINTYWDIATKNAIASFRIKISFLIIIPAIILCILIVKWMRKTRFPNSEDKLPRDFADRIEVYFWNGFLIPKYILFQKDGKYGVIDASNYTITIPAQYDTVIWREHNVSFDARIGENKETIIINQFVNPAPVRSDLQSDHIKHADL